MVESVADNEQPEAAPASAPHADEDPAPDALFEALWQRVVDAWDDDKPHAALLQHALDTQMLPELAGRYRKLVEDPEKGPRAKKKIDGIIVAATQMLMATKAPPRTKTPWTWTLSAALFFAFVLVMLFYKLFFPR